MHCLEKQKKLLKGWLQLMCPTLKGASWVFHEQIFDGVGMC